MWLSFERRYLIAEKIGAKPDRLESSTASKITNILMVHASE